MILDAPLLGTQSPETQPQPCTANPIDAPSSRVAALLDPALFRHYRPDDLVVVTGSDPSNAAYLHPLAAAAFIRMRNAAVAEGLDVEISSGWRSWDRQMRAYRLFRRTGRNLSGDIVPSIAHPAASRHPAGLAVDLEVEENAALGDWLVDNAACFGFAPTRSDEPWEWQFTGMGGTSSASHANGAL